jgi:penicillin-binding protein 2
LIKNANSYCRKKFANKINDKNFDIIKDALYQVCNSPGGTASRSCKTEYGISGKTGSSQVRRVKDSEVGMVNLESIQWRHRDHAFFAGCAPHKSPKYVVAIIIEHGGWGSIAAAPIARKIFDKIMEMENKGEIK